jgi:hypothetical protein
LAGRALPDQEYKQMKISEQAMARLLTRMDEKWTKGECECCGVEDWKVLDRVFQLGEYRSKPPLSGGVIRAPGRPLPVIVTQCKNCGNIRTSSAIALGVVDQQTGRLIDD